MIKQLVVICLCLVGWGRSVAQNITPFKQLRYEEDYSSLQQDSSSSWYASTKFKALSKNGSAYLSMGGDIRYQYQRFTNENWGESPKDNDGFILTRYLAHADFHAGEHFRTFVQLQSSFANGKVTPPSPVDENQLDLHQAFADIAFTNNKTQSLTLRMGRQELLYGSQRLVAVRDGPNNRQSFDAARLLYKRRTWNADIFYSRFVQSKKLIFDDGFTNNTRFWGAYLVKNRIPLINNVDIYYFGLLKKNAKFDDGAGKELRHSLGSRIWNNNKFWRYDIEGLYQFGAFAGKTISAWTFSVNTGYKFANTAMKPEAGIKTELISGDASYNDNKLQTFNPLFPRGGYFGLVSIIGPANLFDIHPSLSLDLARGLYFNMDYDIFWRYSLNDGIYGPNVALIYSGRESRQRSIGRQYSSHIEYIPNEFLYFRCEFTWFKASDFLQDVGTGKNILFAACTAQLKF
ncbi:alginate export family protein [Paraflavitalea sp. CAU 1676]|uniref:alginate export family protein n=1 Tax=Paraflavitalea sp. CAU 1676 TaxID=3032598 RepID=UPI0023DA086F|nr:alginate export family protein [Paraflavitalea sp. CAU 1676]MDF2191541.1 alginate export family protein [Paraflavitalea sp. CAU 1676]